MSTRPSHLGVRHIALHAHAYDEMKTFYADVLGFQIEWEPDADNVYLTSGFDNVALHRAAAPAPARESSLDHLGLLVRSPEDVDGWAAYLDERGIPIDARPKTHRDGARSLYFRDPDGNRVQVIYHPPISEKL